MKYSVQDGEHDKSFGRVEGACHVCRLPMGSQATACIKIPGLRDQSIAGERLRLYLILFTFYEFEICEALLNHTVQMYSTCQHLRRQVNGFDALRIDWPR